MRRRRAKRFSARRPACGDHRYVFFSTDTDANPNELANRLLYERRTAGVGVSGERRDRHCRRQF
jgi:hypothetical protein